MAKIEMGPMGPKPAQPRKQSLTEWVAHVFDTTKKLHTFQTEHVKVTVADEIVKRKSVSELREYINELRGADRTPAETSKGEHDKPAPGTGADALQVGGAHYKEMGIQPWTAMQSWLTPEEFRGFLKGNAIKYLARANRKGGDLDLRKAEHYMKKLNELHPLDESKPAP